ncbi:MAG TPA: hypothetical protein P5531_12820 [Bacteroidales bacterium]|nr:hypothetical protein [Bacteroidales bacterium]HSA44424.1 hypothetical protein [Bacteroidales bacterium]
MEQNSQLLGEIAQILNKMNRQELLSVNKMLIQRIRILDEIRLLSEKAGFQVGCRVSWTDGEGMLRRGTVARINQKTISVIEDGITDGRWKISASLLTRLP